MRHALVVVVFAACSQNTPVVASRPVDERPDWVRYGSSYAMRDGKRMFVGVGVSGNIKNVALLQATADNRARAEVAKIFETYTASLMKDYMSATTDTTSEEQHVGYIIKTMSAQTLSGVQIMERFKDKTTGVMYSRAELDAAAMQDAASKIKDFPARWKRYIVDEGTRAFDAARDEREAAQRRPGICRYRIRVASLTRSSEQCEIPLATELPLVVFPCAGGDVTWFFGDTPLTGHVGAAGSLTLEGSGKARGETGCEWQARAKITGQLKGEIQLDYEESGSGTACGTPCTAHALVLTD